MTANQLYTSRAWVLLRNTRVNLGRQADEVCCRCGRPIEWDAQPRTRWSPSVDHLVPIALGGEELPSLDELAISHFGCNARHGQRVGQAMRLNGIPNQSRARSQHPAGQGSKFLHQVPAAPLTARSEHTPARPPEWAADQGWSPPRLCSEEHPKAVGSYAVEWIPEAEETLRQKLRPWQKFALTKGLEHDDQGHLVRLVVAISASRQSGKSWIILFLAVMRASHPEVFGEPQEVLHVGNNLESTRRIQQKAWRWAESQGYVVTKRSGSERITWENDSTWTISSSQAVWGCSASAALVDEAWDCHPDVVDHALLPVLVERTQPQLWLFSTANPAASLLFQRYRREAMLDRNPEVLLLEWSARPDANTSDERVWRAASAHWSEGRERLMRAASTKKGFREQWLNVWPDRLEGTLMGGWPVGWSDAPVVSGSPPVGATAAVEVSLDGSVYGVAAAVPDGDGVKVWTGSYGTLAGALDALKAWSPGPLLVGQSLAEDVVSGTWTAYPVGMKETRAASAVVPELVKRQKLAHDHRPETRDEVAGAKAVRTEAGIVLSARASVDSVAILKAALWAAWACQRPDDYTAATAAIW